MTVFYALIFSIAVSASTASPASGYPGECVPSSDSISAELPEISVVALKQQESIRKEAASATTIGSKMLASIDATAIKNISEAAPNFYIPDYGSRITSSIYVRGIGARMDNPAVGLMIDNMPVLNKNAYDLELPDIESVQMIRGPQSALYGRNTMAGLINVATLSPLQYDGWKMSATAATHGAFRLSAGWYRRISRTKGISLSAMATHQDGYFKNLYDGKRCDKENSASLRFKLHTKPWQSASLQNTASFSWLRQGGYPYEWVETGDISYNDPCRYRRITASDALTFKKHHRHFTVSSVTSVQYLDDKLVLDQDFTPLSYFTLTQAKREITLNQDLMMRGAAESEKPYSWIAGISGMYKSLAMDAPVTFKTDGVGALIEDHRNKANPYYPISWAGRTFPLSSHFNNPSYDLSLYHESKLKAGSWTFTAGIRAEYERTSLLYRSRCHTAYDIHDNPSGVLPGDWTQISRLPLKRHVEVNIDGSGRLHKDFFELLPKMSVMLTLPDAVSNVYASCARGAKSGGFNTQMFSDVLQQQLMAVMGLAMKYDIDDIVGYEPEHSWNYEIGTHLDIPAAGMQIDAALFYIDCRNQQLTMFPDGVTTGRIMTNAGETRNWGGELAISANIGYRWQLTATYGYTSARFHKFFDGITDYKGKRLPYSPSNTLFAQALYQTPVGARTGHTIEAEADLRGTGPIEWNEANTLRQPLYFTLGASLTWRAPKWSIKVWGKNLTGTRYHTFYFLSMQREFVQRGLPARAGVTFALSI